MKKIIIYVFLLCVLILGFLYFWENRVQELKKEDTKNTVDIVKNEPVSLCYYYNNKTSRGFFDRVYLRLNIDGESVSGEYNNYLAEKDSKVGTFTGIVGSLDQKMMGRRADLWWDSLGEGMQVKEELIIDFGDGSAVVAGGEMIDRGDGVYVYKDKTKISFSGLNLGQISCEDLDQINIVEKYIRNNIKTIATDKPVLGGSWNVMDINIIPSTNSGEVVYEDGHIQSRASFTYEIDSKTQNILIKTFKVEKSGNF